MREGEKTRFAPQSSQVETRLYVQSQSSWKRYCSLLASSLFLKFSAFLLLRNDFTEVAQSCFAWFYCQNCTAARTIFPHDWLKSSTYFQNLHHRCFLTIWNKSQGKKRPQIADYCRLPNGLVFMFVSFSLISSHEGYFSAFSEWIPLLSLNCAQNTSKYPAWKRGLWVKCE